MQVADKKILFSGAQEYTLTTSYVASSAIDTQYAKHLVVYPLYKAGAAETSNTLDFQIEVNPFTAAEDTGDANWHQIGQYTNSSGTWTEQAASYVVNQGTAGSYEDGVPLDFDVVGARQVRILAKESGVASNAGTVKFTVVLVDSLT